MSITPGTRRVLTAAAAATAALAASAASAQAQDRIELRTDGPQRLSGGAINQGWWSATQPNSDGNTNYFVGNNGSHVLRNFFTFQAPAAGTSIERACLQIPRAGSNGNGVVQLRMSDVTTDPVAVNRNIGTSQAIFDDLGDGPVNGDVLIGFGDGQATANVPLTAAGVRKLRENPGKYVSFGGDLLQDDAGEFLFGSSFSAVRLVVNHGASECAHKPVPGSYNADPRISEIDGPAVIRKGGTAQYKAVASDPDGDTLTYWWQVDGPAVIDGSDTGSSVSVRGTGVGPVTLKQTVTDGSLATRRIAITCRVGDPRC